MNHYLHKISLFFLVFSFISVTLTGCATKNESVEIHIMAAASLTNAMNEVIDLYEVTNEDIEITPNFGSSGQLKVQIDNRAPSDLFLSAATRWVDELDEDGHVLSRTDLLKNNLTLITTDSTRDIHGFGDLVSNSVQHVSIGQPETVPAGQYAKETLENIGVYEELEKKLIFASDVRQVLTYVETGNVDAGIVYKTDAINSDKVHIVATANPNSHQPIIYPLVLLEDSQHKEEAKQFYEWLQSPDALKIFEKYGF